MFVLFYFIVTLDYKGLLLILARLEDEDFILGGQGLAVEFCIFCMALRVRLFYHYKTGNIILLFQQYANLIVYKWKSQNNKSLEQDTLGVLL